MKLDRRTEGLVLQRGVAADERQRAAHARLLNEVLGPEAIPAEPGAGPWTLYAFFAPGGRCVASLEAAILPLILDGQRHSAGAIRSAATDPDWRRLGLFRRLMHAALEDCTRRGAPIVLLYTETPALYEIFGFRSLPQHAFVGRPTKVSERSSARVIDLADAADRDVVRKLVEQRAPVSSRCTLLVDVPLFMANLSKDPAVSLRCDATRDVLVIFEQRNDDLVVVDVVAPHTPTAETLMGLLPAAGGMTCLFSPDALRWCGTPQIEDTGLMIRGPIPQAMQQPFMFPPTCEF